MDLSYTASPVAAQEGERPSRKLVFISAILHCIMLCGMGIIAFGVRTSFPFQEFEHLKWIATGALILICVLGLFAARIHFFACMAWLGGMLCAGIALGGWDTAELKGFALNAVGLALCMELFSIFGWALRKESAAIYAAMGLPAVWAAAMAYWAEGMSWHGTTAGMLLGIVLAVAIFLQSRLAERSIIYRHGADQFVAAALSRMVEGLRYAVIPLFGESSRAVSSSESGGL